MTESDLNQPYPADTPLPDATGDGERGDDLTDPELPPVPAGDGTDSTEPAAPQDDDVRPDPCTAMGGQ